MDKIYWGQIIIAKGPETKKARRFGELAYESVLHGTT